MTSSMTNSPATEMQSTDPITLLICTKDRPDFLFRALDFYQGAAGPIRNIIISDASSNENWARIVQRYAEHDGSITLRRASAGDSMPQRIRTCLEHTETDLVFVVADDDIVFLDWLPRGMEILRTHPECAVVVGHTLSFAIGVFSPRGALDDLRIISPNPPLHWLEDERLEDRLRQLTGREWLTTGWYALQRARDLKLITDLAIRSGLDGYAYECFLIFSQAVIGTAVMLDTVFLARQLNRGPNRPPYSFHQEKPHLERLEEASIQLLLVTQGLSREAARSLVRSTYARQLHQLRLNDRRKPLRKLKERFPRLADFYFRTVRTQQPDNGYGDPRLPKMPQLQSISDKVALLTGITQHASNSPVQKAPIRRSRGTTQQTLSSQQP